MGTWGTAILSDDYALDVYRDYLDRYDAGESHTAILAALREEQREALEDPDDAPLFWLAVA